MVRWKADHSVAHWVVLMVKQMAVPRAANSVDQLAAQLGNKSVVRMVEQKAVMMVHL